jgi:hypothetical protein
MVSLAIRLEGMDVNKIEHRLEFYNANGEQLEHYDNMANAFIPPRKGERVILDTRKLALDVTRVDHEFVEYGDFRIGHVIRVHGNQMPWFVT